MAKFSKVQRPLSMLKISAKSTMKRWSRKPPSPPVRSPSPFAPSVMSSSSSAPGLDTSLSAPSETLSPSALLQTSTTPSISLDILFDILQHLLWHSPLSPKARRDVLKAISLVESTWHTIALRVSIRHIHLPGPLSTYALLPSRTLLLTPDKGPLIQSCTSITFTQHTALAPIQQVRLPEGARGCPWTLPPRASSALSFIDCLPNLRHLSLKFIDDGPGYIPHVLHELCKIPFPPQLTHLSICVRCETRSLYWDAPLVHQTVRTVRYLSLSGFPTENIADMFRIFTHVHTLIIPKSITIDRLSLPSLPASVHTLVIRHHRHSVGFHDGWVYFDFLAGLALTGPRVPRLVLRTSVALDDTHSFSRLQRYFERQGLLIEHELDGQDSMS